MYNKRREKILLFCVFLSRHRLADCTVFVIPRYRHYTLVQVFHFGQLQEAMTIELQ